MFQSTYLYKVRQETYPRNKLEEEFQSTYLYKVRQGISGQEIARIMFQSTYLYKVRPVGLVGVQRKVRVSIHVPI